MPARRSNSGKFKNLRNVTDTPHFSLLQKHSIRIAENFNQTVSVKDTEGNAITDLIVGNSFKDNGKTYTLTKNEGILALNISLETVENPSYTETTAGGGTNIRIEDATTTKTYVGGQLLDDDADVEGSYVVELSGGSFTKTIAGGDAVNQEIKVTRNRNRTC